MGGQWECETWIEGWKHQQHTHLILFSLVISSVSFSIHTINIGASQNFTLCPSSHSWVSLPIAFMTSMLVSLKVMSAALVFVLNSNPTNVLHGRDLYVVFHGYLILLLSKISFLTHF
jgi:hypothetical protein